MVVSFKDNPDCLATALNSCPNRVGYRPVINPALDGLQ